MPSQEGVINEAWGELSSIKSQYKNFENTLFENESNSIKQVTQETEKLIDVIGDQQRKLSLEITQARKDLASLFPKSTDERKILQALLTEYVEIEERLNDSKYGLEKELKNKKRFQKFIQGLTSDTQGGNELQ